MSVAELELHCALFAEEAFGSKRPVDEGAHETDVRSDGSDPGDDDSDGSVSLPHDCEPGPDDNSVSSHGEAQSEGELDTGVDATLTSYSNNLQVSNCR